LGPGKKLMSSLPREAVKPGHLDSFLLPQAPYTLPKYMFDPREYVSDIEECIIATGKPHGRDDVHQPEFYYALLKASILKLPDTWDSVSQRLILELKNPSLEELSESLSKDISGSGGDLSKVLCFETLLRFTTILTSSEHSLRSAGPA
jgi:hypothetical protein